MLSVWGGSPGGGKVLLKLVGELSWGRCPGGMSGGDVQGEMSVTAEDSQCRDLTIRVTDHSMSLKVIPFDRLGMVSY